MLTIKLSVDAVFQERPWAEVDEFELAGFQVDKNVLVFNVSVQYSTPSHRLCDADDLTEKLPGCVLIQSTFLRDKVKQVLDGVGAFHHQDKGVWTLKCIQELDHAVDGLRFSEKAYFHGHVVTVDLWTDKAKYGYSFGFVFFTGSLSLFEKKM